LIAKNGKDYTAGEKIIKPALKIYLKTVLERGYEDYELLPLSNNTVNRRTDEISQDVENQLVLKLRKKFSIQMDKSTIRDGEAVLISYVRYIDKDEFVEEFLFCLKLKGSTTARDIFNILKNY
jgi:hypothetical protein